MGRIKLLILPTAIFHVTACGSAEMTGSLGGMDVGDSGRSGQHVNQTSVLACSPLSCLSVCMAWIACVTMATELYVCMHVCISNRRPVTAGKMLCLSFGLNYISHTASVKRSEYSVDCGVHCFSRQSIWPCRRALSPFINVILSDPRERTQAV